jgi:predicted TIM-barrel fold metal-dependent hydrolase
MKQQLLDPFNVERAVLGFDVGLNVGVPNIYLATELARAANDWSLDAWLSGTDDRLYGAMMIPTQVPEEAAKEIRRAGRHDRFAAVLISFNGLGRPLGHPVYHPIYEAAEEMGLPVAVHNGVDGHVAAGPMFAGGLPNSRLEYHTLLPQSLVTHVVSLLTHGVFEKYPRLKVLAMEFGVAWLPWLLWGLDRHHELLRRESPFVKRPPSEYFREHIRLSTQPLELSPEPRQLMQLLESVGGVDDLLLFASDYPHWDTDDPRYIARSLPRGWWPKISRANALDFYRWPKADR